MAGKDSQIAINTVEFNFVQLALTGNITSFKQMVSEITAPEVSQDSPALSVFVRAFEELISTAKSIGELLANDAGRYESVQKAKIESDDSIAATIRQGSGASGAFPTPGLSPGAYAPFPTPGFSGK